MTTPYPFQLAGVRKIERFGGRAILGDWMGMGKSLQSLLFAQNHPEARPIVVVCPAYLKHNWRHEAAMHVGMHAEILSGEKPPQRVLGQHASLLIINYEILPYWLDYLKALKPQLIIADEAQYISSPKALRTKACQALREGAKYVLALTGTPITNRPAEIWSILNFVRPDLFPTFWPFAKEFCAPKHRPWGMDFSGSSNLEKLHDLLYSEILIRRRKCDVLDQLPAQTTQVILLDLEDRGEYERAEKDFAGWLRKTAPKKVRKALKAEAVVKVGYLLRLVAKLKARSVLQWTDDFLESDEKLMLFAKHREMIHTLAQPNAKRCVVVDGSVTGHKRQLAFDRFNKNKATRLLITNRAGNKGWNAISASTVANVELEWTPGEHAQMAARVHGIKRGVEGQRSRVFFLIGAGTLEEDLCRLLQKKQQVISTAIDGGPSVGDLDVLDKLLEALKSKQQSPRTHKRSSR